LRVKREGNVDLLADVGLPLIGMGGKEKFVLYIGRRWSWSGLRRARLIGSAAAPRLRGRNGAIHDLDLKRFAAFFLAVCGDRNPRDGQRSLVFWGKIEVGRDGFALAHPSIYQLEVRAGARAGIRQCPIVVFRELRAGKTVELISGNRYGQRQIIVDADAGAVDVGADRPVGAQGRCGPYRQ